MKERAVAIQLKIRYIEVAAQIASFRPLYLHNAGTKICQSQRSRRTGKKLT
jgi:hypothetical protein